jgi:uncharacterized protein YndB with AHSA1/START domain
VRSFEAEIKIAAPPSRVWEVLADVERWGDWTPTIGSVVPLDGVPLRVGARARLEQPELRTTVWEVTSWEPGRGFSWKSTNPGLSMVADHVITPVLSDSRYTARLQYTGLLSGFVGWWYGDLINRYLDLEMKGLKERSERIG